MTTALACTTCAATGAAFATALHHFGPQVTGIAIAIGAACVVAAGAVKAARTEQRAEVIPLRKVR